MERPPTPDRHKHERRLSELHERIGKSARRRTELGGDTQKGVIGEMKLTRDELSNLAEQRKTIKLTVKALEAEIRELKAEIEAKKPTLSENEVIGFKTEQRLDEKIRQLESVYSNTQQTIRDEKSLVKEIDKLKRDKKKFATYNAAFEEKVHLESKVKTLRNQMRIEGGKFRRLGPKRDGNWKKLRDLKEEYKIVSSTLRELSIEKRSLIRNYDQLRVQRRTWDQQQGRRRPKKTQLQQSKSGPSRRPPSYAPWAKKKGQDESDSSDDEQLEPFNDEKQACDSLLNYLRYLLTHVDDMQITEFALAPARENKASSSESMDDEGLTRLRRPSDADLGPSQSPRLRKRPSKKSSKKGTQSINHSMEQMQAFAKVNANAPITYADVPASIAEVSEIRQYYEAQTALPPGGDDDYAFTYPSSESEMTSDSGAWGSISTDFSEMSLSFTQTSASAVCSPEAIASPDFERIPRLTSSPTLTVTAPHAAPVEYQRSLSDGTKQVEQTQPQLHATGGSVEQMSEIVELLGSLSSRVPATSADEGIDTAEAASKESSVNSASVPASLLAMRESSGVVPDLPDQTTDLP